MQSRLELLLQASELVVTMKNLLACLAFLVAFCAHAQVNDFQLPYNPDSEPNGYIGAADVVELLTYYGQAFTPDGIYVNDDSTHVLMDVGDLTYPECAYTCQHTLPGSWRMATVTDAGAAFNAVRGGLSWINPEGFLSDKDTYGNVIRFHWNVNGTFGEVYDFDVTRSCFCATHERPKVEYSYCYGDALNGIQGCCDEKVQDGWYPLGSLINSNPYAAENDTRLSQAFWRWAD